MKNFSLVTEYSETELVILIEQAVQKILQQELPKVISQLDNSPLVSDDCKLLTRKELKSILHFSYPTLAKLTKEGILRAKIVGSSYRYLKSDITKYLKEDKINISQEIKGGRSLTFLLVHKKINKIC